MPSVIGWKNYLLVAGVCLLLWLLLVGSVDSQELIAGAVVAVLIPLMFSSRLAIFTGFKFSWLAPLYIASYLGNFLLALLRANFDLARRVLSPSLPIRPDLFEYLANEETRHKRELEKTYYQLIHSGGPGNAS